MVDEKRMRKLCRRYGISYKIFHNTEIILLETPLDEYMIKLTDAKDKSVCLMHKNKLFNRHKYHIQREFSDVYQAIDSIAGHNKMKHIYSSMSNNVGINRKKDIAL